MRSKLSAWLVVCGMGLMISIVRAQSTAPAGRQWVVDQQNPVADDAGPGSAERPFKTIAPAAREAQPGDTVLVKAGLYREQITPARGGQEGRPITYQGEPGTIVRGSEVWSPTWQPDGEEIFFANFDSPIFKLRNPFLEKLHSSPINPEKNGPAEKTEFWSGGQLFVADKELDEVQTAKELQKPGTWRVDVGRKGLQVHFDGPPPADGKVQVSIRKGLFAPHRRGLGYITVRGFTFEQCANPGPLPWVGAVTTRSGHHWIIENNTIRFARACGIDCGSESWKPADMPDTDPEDRKLIFAHDNLIRGNTITDCGVQGIAGWHFNKTRIVGNIIERNDTHVMPGRDGEGAIRVWNCDVLVEGNLIRDNHSWGIWMDNSWDHSRITRNLIVDNGSAGVFMELGNGPGMIDHNLIGLSHAFGKLGAGYGVYTHDSSGVTIANNLIWDNQAAAILMRTVSARTFHDGSGVHVSDERIMNNLLLGSTGICLPYPNPLATDNRSDWNVLTAKDPFTINWNRISPDLRKQAETRSPGGWDKVDPVRWKTIQGTDENSIIAAGLTVSFDAQSQVVKLDVPSAVAAMQCPAIDNQTDFAGHSCPGKVPPGPFSTLHAGSQTIRAWPITVEP